MDQNGRDRWVEALAVVVVTALSACAHRLWQPGFDEWWHLFLADVEPFSFAWEGMRTDSHPPLGYLLLRPLGALAPGWTRALGVAGMALSAVLLHRVARLMDLPFVLRAGVVAVCCASPTWIGLGLAVRGYGLAMPLFLVAVMSCARWMRRDGDQPVARDAWGLWLAGGMALPWIVGVGGILFAVTMAGLVAASLLGGRLAPVRSAIGQRAAVGVAALSLLGLAWWLRCSDRPHPRLWLAAHLPPRDGAGLEWWAEALAAQWRLFLPLPQGDPGRWLGAVLLLALPILALRLVRARRDAEALAPLIILLAFGAIAVAAALERYPFGGKMRHQGLLLPLVWLSVAVAVSRWARPSSRLGRGLLLLGIAGCVGWQASRWGEAPGPDEFHRELMWSNDRDVWVATAGADDPLMTDAFSHVGCWAWSKSEGQRWRHRGSVGPGGVSWDLFDVDGGGLTRRVARLTSTWKWGRGDAIATALQADAMVAPRGPWDRVWLYVRDPQRTDGGGAADIEARQSLDLALASLGLRIVADVPRPASRLWGIGR